MKLHCVAVRGRTSPTRIARPTTSQALLVLLTYGHGPQNHGRTTTRLAARPDLLLGWSAAPVPRWPRDWREMVG